MRSLSALVAIIFLVPAIDAGYGEYCCDASEIWYEKLSEKDGKPPQCGSNCTYLSSKNKKVMPCSLEACGHLQSVEDEPSPPEFCATTHTGTDICTPDISFIKFHGTDERKIALRVQFSPSDYADIKYIKGFRVYITDGIETYSRCYFFNKTMTFNDNIKDIFVNDCFLPTQRKGKPLFDIRISIASLPLKIGSPSSSEKTIVVKVPKRGHGVVVSTPYCKNSSVQYSYRVEPGFGRKASIEICKLDHHGDCQPETNKKIVQRHLNASGTLYNLTFDSLASYRIFLYGKRSHGILNFTTVNFSSCHEEVQSTPFPATTVLAVAIGIIVLVIFLAVVPVWRQRNGNNSQNGKRTESQEHLRNFDDSESGSSTASRVDVLHVHEDPEIRLREPPTQKSTENEQQPLSVFVAYANDHELHEKAVESFCAYLRFLGLRVAVRLWDYDDENEKYTDNTHAWVINKVTDSDRVVMICSAGTNHRLGVGLNREDREFCEFAAVANQALHEHEPSKFLVCYFNYSPEGCIPEELGKVYRSHYKLMDNIKDFYFHLIGKEKYIPRGKRCYNELEPECWGQVQEHVQSMNKYATENPTWYNDTHGLDVAETNELLTTDPKPEDDTKLDDDANDASRADDSEFQFQQKEASNEANPFESAEDGTAPAFTQPRLTEDTSGNWNQPTPHETDRLLPHNVDDEQQFNSGLELGEIGMPNNIRHGVLASTNNSDFRRQGNELPHERVDSELPCGLSSMQNNNRHSDESREHGYDVAADPDHAREAMEMALEFLHRGPVSVDTDDVSLSTNDVIIEGPSSYIDPFPVGPSLDSDGPVAAVVRMPTGDAMYGSSMSVNETSDTEPVSENTTPKSVEVDENESMVQLCYPRNESHSSRESLSGVGGEGSANLEHVADSPCSMGCENDGDPQPEIDGGVIEGDGIGSSIEGYSNASSFFTNFCQNIIDSKQ